MRRAITLTEVLISMGLMTLGLLGVMSIFPAGSYYLNRADIADNGSAIGRAVMSDLITRGMLDPEKWTSTNLTAGIDPSQSYAQQFGFQRDNLAGTADQVRQANSLLGSVIVLDPLGVASHLAATHFDPAAGDPAITDRRWLLNAPGRTNYNYYGTKAGPYWAPFKATPFLGPMRRVTFSGLMMMDASGAKTDPASVQNSRADKQARLAAARFVASVGDDLVSEAVTEDLPASFYVSRADVNSDGIVENLSRQSVGDYSWMVTIAPTNLDARNELGRRKAEGYYFNGDEIVHILGYVPGTPAACDVSVVVMHKRDFAMSKGSTATFNWSPSEALIPAAIKSSGPTGGEILMTDLQNTNALDNLRAGRWVALCGPHPNSSVYPLPPPPAGMDPPPLRPQFFFAWYQVQAIDAEISSADKTTVPQRYVSLRGPGWPWEPAANVNANVLSNDLCVAIFPAAVAVHTKTIRVGQ